MGSADMFENHDKYMDDLKKTQEQQAMIEQAEKANEILRQQAKLRQQESQEFSLPVAKVVSVNPLFNIKFDNGAEYFMTPDQFTQFLVSKKIPDSVESVSKVIRGFKQEWKDRSFSAININCEIF